MQILVTACNTVTTKTVVNCFRKSKILNESEKVTIAEDDYPSKELEKEIQNQRSIQPGLVLGDMDGASFTDVYTQVLAMQPPLLVLRL